MFANLSRKLSRFTSAISPDTLRRALDAATVGRTDILLVHSAVSGCGYFSGGMDDVMSALRGVTHTLCLPTHTYCYPTAVGQPGPVFDYRTTPSKNGILTETFRKQSGVLRSINATHSLGAAGPFAATLIADHELLDAPCGQGSPWGRLVERNGSVLLFGVSFRAYTPYHTAEDAAASLFAYEPGTIDRLRYVGTDGQVHERRSRRQSWTPRRFQQAGDLLESAGLVRRVALGRGHLLFVKDSAKVHDFLVERLRKVPDFLYHDCKAPLQ